MIHNITANMRSRCRVWNTITVADRWGMANVRRQYRTLRRSGLPAHSSREVIFQVLWMGRMCPTTWAHTDRREFAEVTS